MSRFSKGDLAVFRYLTLDAVRNPPPVVMVLNVRLDHCGGSHICTARNNNSFFVEKKEIGNEYLVYGIEDHTFTWASEKYLMPFPYESDT